MFSNLVDGLEKAANKATSLADLSNLVGDHGLMDFLGPSNRFIAIWTRDCVSRCVARWRRRTGNNRIGGRQVSHFVCWKEALSAKEAQ